MSKIKLAIISTHPIQYNAPMFALLAKSNKIQPKVFYTWSQSRQEFEDKDFGKTIKWDIPLLEGYDYEFSENVSNDPGPHTGDGIVCPELNNSIEKWGANAVLVYGWNLTAHYEAMKYFKGKIPVYFRGDSTLLDEHVGLRKVLRRLYLNWVYRKVDAAFYVGEKNKEYFIKHGVKEERLFFAPHAIDNDRFASSSGEYMTLGDAWRRKLGIEREQILVLFVGKFEHKKNPLILIEAAKKLDSEKYQFVFVGNGNWEDKMRELSEGMPNVHYLPFQNQSQIPHVYQMCDVLALPSQGPGETWGLVVNEAMACGKAVLVSDKCGCYADLVENGTNGYVFKSGDLDECVDSLSKLGKKEEVKKMGFESNRMIQNWSFAEIVKSFEKYIKA